MTKYFDSLEENLQLADINIWEQKFMHTGRKVCGTESYLLAKEWADLVNRDDMIKHPAAKEFRAFIPKILCVDSPLECFRFRPIKGEPPSSDEMGPPPIVKETKGGRYNRPNEHVLYLSDSENGIIRESIAQDLQDLLYIQQYSLPTDILRIADLTKTPSDHFLCQVFTIAEECMVKGRGIANYNFSQIVAELVNTNFHGMRVPGVHGVPGKQYSNIVIFCPFPDWYNWLKPGSDPYCLSF